MSDCTHVLPDVLGPGLRVAFCVRAAGKKSAELGHYYAKSNNKFWRVLHEVGLTPRQLRPAEDREVLQWGIGLTDLAKYASGMDHELPVDAIDDKARATLKAKILEKRPKILAFTSLKAGREYLDQPEARAGEQRERIGATRI